MAGNLCRCTGYDGIIDGVRTALAIEATEGGPAETVEARGAPSPPRPIERAAVRGSGRVYTPDSLEAALDILADEPGAVPVAGATDLFVHWPQKLEDHGKTYVDLSRIGSLEGHRWTDRAREA